MDNLQVGTLGWNHANWVGGFYPDDMPEDWWLDYYANLYRVVLVPQQEWLRWDREELEEIEDAVEGEFSFYFQIVGSIDNESERKLSVIVDELAELAVGAVVFADASHIDHTICGLPVTQISKSESIGEWQWQTEGIICSGNPFGWINDLTTDPKQQPDVVRSFMQSLPNGVMGAPLIVNSQNLNIQQLQNLKTVAELLGY